MRNGTKERIHIGLGFKLTNFMSFGESLFFIGLFQKTQKEGPIHQKERNLITTKHTREDRRRHQKARERSRGRVAAKWGWSAPPAGRLAPPEGIVHELLECSSIAS
jgi:hypothetical protein